MALGLRKEEGLGLGIAIAAHAALVAVLLLRPHSAPVVQPPERIEVTITVQTDGTVYLEKEPLAPGTLAERLAGIPDTAEGKKPLVTLRADKALDYGKVMDVMGELNRAGFTSISLVTGVSGGSGQ